MNKHGSNNVIVIKNLFDERSVWGADMYKYLVCCIKYIKCLIDNR